ncbi:MAG: hypothetical protein K2L22_05250 [Muribaculaceae bacterium]|nr:hypothetical protein [Muribaculaceae bacterium]
MKRILILSLSAFMCILAYAQPMGMQPQSTYEQVDEVRKQLNLDHSKFEKVYSAYDKYNKAIFGNQSNGMTMPTPPAGGRPGDPMGNRPGNGGNGKGPGFGGGHPGGQPGAHPDFNGQRPGRPGNDQPNGVSPKPEDIKKLENKRAKQEEKLVKSMQKIFKKDPAAFSKWQVIRNEQLKRMFQLPPAPDRKPVEHRQ